MSDDDKVDVAIDRVDCDRCRKRIVEVLHKITTWPKGRCETVTRTAPTAIVRGVTREEGEKVARQLLAAGATAYLWKDYRRVEVEDEV